MLTSDDDADLLVVLARGVVDDALRMSKRTVVCADLCGTVPDFERMRRCTIVNFDRYLPSRQLIRQQLDAGKLGEPGLIRVHRWEPAPAERMSAAFRRDLDCVLWCFGRLPEKVYAVENVAGVQVHLGFPGGGMATLDHADRLLPGDGYGSFSVIGARGAAYADDHLNMHLAFHGGPSRAIRAEETAVALSAGIQAFVNVESENPQPPWRQTLAVAEAIRTSLRTRRAVSGEGS